MSAPAGWYPDPGGGLGLYRYWDGRAWSAATSPHPQAPPPTGGLTGSSPTSGTPSAGGPPSGPTSGAPAPGGAGPGTGAGGGPAGAWTAWGQQGTAYAPDQQVAGARSSFGWWVGAAVLVAVLAIVAVFAVRAVGGNEEASRPTGGRATQDVCPPERTEPESPAPHPNDGRVHGGPVSFAALPPPWSAPYGDDRVPFGSDVQQQTVTVEANYAPGSSWVASVLVAELQAGDGFYTPEQGADIVVRCILGQFYGDAAVTSDVQVDRAQTIDGQAGWLVESQLSFDIPNLRTRGELLIVAIVPAGANAGLFYASIPDTRPELVAPARQALASLQVDP